MYRLPYRFVPVLFACEELGLPFCREDWALRGIFARGGDVGGPGVEMWPAESILFGWIRILLVSSCPPSRPPSFRGQSKVDCVVVYRKILMPGKTVFGEIPDYIVFSPNTEDEGEGKNGSLN